MENRFFKNIAEKKISPGCVVTLSDLTVSELAGDFPHWRDHGVDWFTGSSNWGAMETGIRA